MSGRWFRFYAEAIRNPKVARLSDWEYRIWTELLGVASENDGAIPCAEDLKHILKRRLDHVLKALNALIRAGLIDALGEGYEPHNWSKFQYKSDVSTDRVHKHRAKRNVSETPPETEADTDTEETGSSEPVARAKSNDFPRLDCASPDVWRDFLKNRVKKNLPNTASAHRKLVRDLDAMATQTGWPPGKVFTACVEQGWGAIYATDEMKGSQNGRLSGQDNRGSLRGSRPDPALDMLYQAQRELQAEAQAERQDARFDRPLRLAVSSN